MMRIGELDLTEKWDELINQPEFTREYTDALLDIQYGVKKGTKGIYSFFVSGKEKGQDVTTENFIHEADAGVFRKQFNRLRRLRPGGQDRKPGRQDDLPAGVEKCGFSCQNPTDSLSLLLRHLFGTLTSTDSLPLRFNWNVYPNLAPFEPGGHLLLLPSASFPELPHFPQLFTPLLIEDFFNLCQHSTDLMVFFNSRHAGATQDHFHLQAVFHVSDLPIQKQETQQKSFRSGQVQCIGSSYPLNVLVYTFEDKKACSQHILNLQTKGVPFNLIFLKNRFFLVPRDINNEIVSEFPNVLASMEISGKFIISDKEAFENATEERIRSGLAKIAVAIDSLGL